MFKKRSNKDRKLRSQIIQEQTSKKNGTGRKKRKEERRRELARNNLI